MKYTNEVRVYYADTDAYQVVWHGAYLRWMEAARVELTNLLGLDLKQLQETGDILPVRDLSVKYKSSAKLDDIVKIETEIEECSPVKIVFKQIISNKETGEVNIEARVTCVAVNTHTGKMYRRIRIIFIMRAKNRLLRFKNRGLAIY